MKKLFLILSILIFSSLNVFSQVGAGDCPGLCVTGGGTFTAVAGVTSELNPSNDGCLNSLEATSSFWYQVCFTSNGVFSFYINPGGGNSNDYDFAVWDGSSCPPTVNPIRCSYAAVWGSGPCADCTGLASGAPDNSEGVFGDGWVNTINVINGQCLTININNYGLGSNNFLISFVGTTATMYCPTPLPVGLIEFDGENNNQRNIITWTTASEINNDYFTLKSSSDMIKWKNVAEIDGSGNSNIQNIYTVYDETPYQGITYYKLEQTDYDGTTKIYGPISVKNNNIIKNIVKVYDVHGKEYGVNIPYGNPGFYIVLYDDNSFEKIVITN